MELFFDCFKVDDREFFSFYTYTYISKSLKNARNLKPYT